MKGRFDGMNGTYGYTIKSSKFSQYLDYIVFANNIEEANLKIKKEIKEILSEEDGWTWGTPDVKNIDEIEMKQLKMANIIW